MITTLLAQALEPIKLVTGDEAAAVGADRTVWVVIGTFAIALLVILLAALLVRRARAIQADPERAAWRELCSKMKVGARDRTVLEQLAHETEIKPCALLLSRAVMERAVLLGAPRFPRAKLQRACALVWPDVEVPGGAGQLPTVTMPPMQQLSAPKRPRLRATA